MLNLITAANGWTHVNKLLKKAARLYRKHSSPIRQMIFGGIVRFRAGSVVGPIRINGYSLVTANTHIGRNVNMNGLRIEGHGKVIIGDNFHSGPQSLIITGFHNYDSGEAIPYDNSNILKDVTIEDNVWIGTRVILLGGVTLGEGSIIQAGSVVVSSIPPYAIAGGSPAKVFKYRDIEHYQRLKQAGKFN